MGWVIELREGIASIPRDTWNAVVGDGSPFLEWEWLASLEHAGCVGAESGWHSRPLVLCEDDRLVAACPLYVKDHSEGEFVFDWGWAEAAGRAGLSYYPKLLVGVPFTPVTGARFLTAPGIDRQAAVAQLGAGLRDLCRANALSGVHVNFCLPDEVATLESADYLLRVGVQYHWRNAGYRSFDDYLAHLRSKRRNQIRRERRSVREQGVTLSVLRGDAISETVFEAMFACYRATVDAHPYGRRYLNRRFFALLRERYSHRLCFVVARKGDEIVAGTTNVVKGDALYGRYWGSLRPVRCLHFDACYYTAIEHCIEQGIARFEPGAGGDYKFLRGFDPQPTYSLHHLADRRLAQAVGRYLSFEREDARATIEALHRHSQLKQRATALPAKPGESS